MKNIVIFASGSGSNAENIAKYFKGNKDINLSCILSNNPDAYVLERAKNLNIPSFTFNRNDFYHTDRIINYLKENDTDYIILAGFLWLIPSELIKNYPNRIINIHPALLPNYGGKGMYGMNVHKAVVENGEKESGISIHLVNEKYDEGSIIFQAKCNVSPKDTPEDVASKVHELEYLHFPKEIERFVNK